MKSHNRSSSSSIGEALAAACVDDDDALAGRILAAHPWASAMLVGPMQMTPLMHAADAGSVACVKLLLSSGNPLAQDVDGNTALIHAAVSRKSPRQAEVAEALAPLSNAGAKNNRGSTALIQAAASSNPKLVAVLAAAAPWGESNLSGQTALMLACAVGCSRSANILLGKADVFAKDAGGKMAFAYAAMGCKIAAGSVVLGAMINDSRMPAFEDEVSALLERSIALGWGGLEWSEILLAWRERRGLLEHLGAQNCPGPQHRRPRATL